MADKESKPVKPARSRAEEAPTEPLALIGIGVCAASLRSLISLFDEMTEQLGAAYVVAVRQQDGLTPRAVVEALSGHTSLRVQLAKNGDKLAAETLYVGGGSELITINDGSLDVRPATEPVGHRGTVDSLLISLAEDARDRAVAVILAGLGSDGTAGVTATKDYGGLSIAQSLNGEEDAAEQGAASPAGIVDLLCPIEDLPRQIALYVRGLKTITPESGDVISEHVSKVLSDIAGTLRTVTGNDFHGYKVNTFLRRVQRRMQVTRTPDIDTYAASLRKNRDEVHHLFQDLLIGVTQFFRDPKEFDALAKELPRLFEGKGPGDHLRVWVLGCATGEEAYSLAILLSEYLQSIDNGPSIQIFATDLDARALGSARAARYSSAISEHVPPERLARWFLKEGNTYRICKELREMCIFSPHNLIKDAPFSRIDLLSCRNLLIYLNTELQDKVIPIFHFSLRPGGILFLGASENVTRHQKLFAPIDRRNRIFRRLTTATKVLPEFPLTARHHSGGDPRSAKSSKPTVRSPNLTGSIGRRADQVAERYAPAYVITDTQYEVLHFSGRTGRFLEPATGAANLNLLNLVHRDLRLDLRTALHHALEENTRTEHLRIPINDNGRSILVNLIVEPLLEAGDVTTLVILFQDAGPIPESVPGTDRTGASADHVERLEAELRLTKDRLQATIEELESTNEELKSSNEEYQSINEELQSSNEELETSKEELQSVNEELQTVNAELDHRVRDLARANSDLRNLLESTQIATIFLDNDLGVRSFTPAATDIFHLLDTDIGRPIDHLGARVAYPELSDDVRKVLSKLGTVEREVTSREGQHYIARVHPYRSVDNFIAGAVLTFLDVTGTVKAESALRESEGRLRNLLAELQHRVRNTLAVVKAITRRTAETSGSVEEMAAHLSGRLDAFARVQSAVTRNPESGISLASLVRDELLAHAAHEGEHIRITGTDVALRPKAAESISLALHELATNAVKHGALSSKTGRIAIKWGLDGNGAGRRLDFEWAEDGVDGVDHNPQRSGFGMELLTRILPYDLLAQTSVEFGNGGLRFQFQVPAEQVIQETEPTA